MNQGYDPSRHHIAAAAEQTSQSTYGSIPFGGSERYGPANIHNLHLRSSSGLGESVRLIVNGSLVFDGEACSVRDMGGQATIPSEVVNIAKNLIGGGVFSLSGGMTIYSDNPAAVWSASDPLDCRVGCHIRIHLPFGCQGKTER